MKFGHGIIKCSSCNKIIAQCRCLSTYKKIEYSVCENCEKKKTGLRNVDEERIDIAWDKFIDVLTEESMDGCDGASDEFLLGIIRNKIQQSYPESYNKKTET